MMKEVQNFCALQTINRKLRHSNKLLLDPPALVFNTILKQPLAANKS